MKCKTETEIQVKLPPWGRFASTDKKNSPYDKFFHWSARRVDPKWTKKTAKKINVSAVSLSKEDGEKLDDLVKTWMKKYHKLAGVRLKREFGHFFLAYSPAYFDQPSGVAYIDQNELFVAKE